MLSYCSYISVSFLDEDFDLKYALESSSYFVTCWNRKKASLGFRLCTSK